MGRVRAWAAVVVAIALATALLDLGGLPSAPLFGGLVGALVVALRSSPPLRMPEWLFRLGQALVGVTIGAMVDWARFAELGWAWPAVFVVCLATLILSVLAGQLLRRHGISRATASFASVAGGASGMAALARDYGADDRVVTVVQYVRVLLILLTLPLVVSWISDPGPTAVTGGDPSRLTWTSVAYATLAVVAGLVGGRVLHLPSPAVLGGLLAGSGLTAVPAFEGVAVPDVAVAAGFILIGASVGLRFTSATIRQIGTMMPTVFVVVAIIVGLCAGLGLLLSAVTGVDRLDAYLATTPGGLPAVLAAAASTGGDVTFITSTQLLRILIAIGVTPFIARWLLGRPRGD